MNNPFKEKLETEAARHIELKQRLSESDGKLETKQNSTTVGGQNGGGSSSIPPPPAPPPPNPECDMKDLNKMFGMTASDIDKYSRVFFPVTFTCFQLMYWVIYQHLSDHVVDDLVYLHPD